MPICPICLIKYINYCYYKGASYLDAQRGFNMKKEVKFQLSELLGIGMTLVVLGIGLAYGLQVMGDVKDDFTDTSSAEYNATVDAIDGVAKIPEKLPTIATVVVAAVIIGILVTYLWMRFR